MWRVVSAVGSNRGTRDCTNGANSRDAKSAAILFFSPGKEDLIANNAQLPSGRNRTRMARFFPTARCEDVCLNQLCRWEHHSQGGVNKR